ncbi:hypothetical protein [Promicromonospora soli]|uniref:Lipoprotein LprG n=1 Tax=Promicromonospora soli TaxID=2035533 RepID=A0A919G795_9MICO|nr:hypothetical protein [Promicromonospora soli]GHH79462.1 hypothetical protein GCM10017772_45280 [Promicromonospora soli]
MTIDSKKGGVRATRTLRAGLVLGMTVCVAAAVAGCSPAGDTGTARTTDPTAAAPAPSAEVATPSPSDDSAPTTIPFEAGHVPDGWSQRDGVACGMSATDLVTQDDRFSLELTGPMVTGADGTVYQPVLLEHELGDDATLDFGDDAQLVWAQGDVVVDLDLGWQEGGGPILEAADAEGLPTGDYSAWEEDATDPAMRRISGLTGVANATTCWPSGVDEGSGFTNYDDPRPDGEYDVRAVVLAMVDGESRLVVSDPVTVDWVAPAVD